MVSPLGVFEAGLVGFEAGVEQEVALGRSGALLDRMLENDIGSCVLVLFGSSETFAWTCALSSSTVPCEAGRSIEPFVRDGQL